MRFIDLGLISFQEGLRQQEKALQETRHRRQPETVYLLEHPHVFTMGRAGKAENVLSREDRTGKSIELVQTNRGGDVTYHGPGQLVGYPHLDLRQRGRDVHRFLRDLEKSLIQTVAHFGVAAFVKPGLTGVWTGRGKLASIGINVSRWITKHGFALNVNTDLSYYKLIHPCGILNCPVTSLSDLLGGPVDLDEVKQVFQCSFEEVFEENLGTRRIWGQSQEFPNSGTVPNFSYPISPKPAGPCHRLGGVVDRDSSSCKSWIIPSRL